MDSTFGVIKHWLSYHSEDRDPNKNTNPAIFDIDFPVDFKNVVTLRLNDIHLPLPFTTYAFIFNTTPISFAGVYSNAELAAHLSTLLSISVTFNENTRIFTFTSPSTFLLDFTSSSSASFLGFSATTYSGTVISSSPPFQHLAAYLDIAPFNAIDELMPFPDRSNALFASKTGGSHSASFCKIPLTGTLHTSLTTLSNFFYADPPLERLSKVKARLRYHDGTLLDIRSPFTFTLEITCLRNEFNKLFTFNKTGYSIS